MIADASGEEVVVARRSLELIEARGYHRGPNLGEALSQAIIDATA